MVILELTIVLLTIFLGIRLGGVGVGFTGGLDVLVLATIGVKPGNIPFDVISIITAVIAAAPTIQIADGLDYLVHQTERLLRKNLKYIMILVPIVAYFLTILAGTGNISLAALPVVVEVTKEQGTKPYRPLSTAVVPAQIAITASSISTTVVYMSSVMEGHDISYIHLLSVIIPFTLLAIPVMSFLVTALLNSKLPDDSIYRGHLEEDSAELRSERQVKIETGTKTSVWLFPLGVVCAVIYTTVNSPSFGSIAKPLMNTTSAILIIMLSTVTLTTTIYRVETDSILNSSTSKAGMSACICTLGVAWLGNTFVSHSIDWIKGTAGNVIQGHPWLLAVIFFLAPALLYSQAAAARTLMPVALALNVSPLTAVVPFTAVSGLFILPTYLTLAAAVQMDDTGTIRIGKFALSYPLFVPGTLGTVLAACFSFLLGSFML